MPLEQLLLIAGTVLIVFVLVFGLARIWPKRKLPLLPKPRALSLAEQDISSGDLKSGVINLFIASERSLKERLAKKGSAFELIDEAREVGLIDTASQDFLHKLRLLRNKLVHEGSQRLSLEQMQHLLASTKRALRALGYNTAKD